MSAGPQFDWSKFGAKPATPTSDEISFQNWYGQWARRLNLNQNPDAPEHFYDYRAAYRAGASPDASGHWPSKFKLPGHPRLIINGVDTRTGQPSAAKPAFDWAQFDAKPVASPSAVGTKPQAADLSKPVDVTVGSMPPEIPGYVLTQVGDTLQYRPRRPDAPQPIAENMLAGMRKTTRNLALSATEPESLAIGAALAIPGVNAVAAPVLAAHGAKGVYDAATAPGGITNPENLEAALLSGSEMAGGAAMAKANPIKLPALKTGAFLSESIPSRLINSILKTPKTGYRFGKNPGLAVAQEGITATSEEALLAGIKQRAGEIQVARNAELANAANVKPIDVHKVVRDALGPEIDSARRVGNRAGAEALRRLAKDLQAEHPRMMTPAEATAFKSELAGATNWTSDAVGAALNDGRRRVVNRLRFQVELRVPKVAKLNERWGNLIEAEKALDNAIATKQRANIVGVGDVVFGTAGGIAGAMMGEPTLGSAAGVGLRRLAGSVPVKTYAAAKLAKRNPKP